MDCTETQKVHFGTHMLASEADDQWVSTLQWLNVANEEIAWTFFTREFLRKYFPEDIRGKEEIEFMELKHGDLSVTKYAAKFVELAKFYHHYSEATNEFSKCIKFENGLPLEIKKSIGYQQIHKFPELVNSFILYEEDNKAYYKIISEGKGKQHQNYGKPYNAPIDKGKHRVVDGKKTCGGGAPADVVYYKCGKPGLKSNACTWEEKRSFCCGKLYMRQLIVDIKRLYVLTIVKKDTSVLSVKIEVNSDRREIFCFSQDSNIQ